MKALFSRKDLPYKQKLYNWFRATIRLHLQNRQLLWGLFIGNSLTGLAMISDTSKKPSASTMFRWIWSVSLSCGIGTFVKTFRHDQSRRQHFISKQQLVLEFIAVDAPYRGQGMGGLLMEKLQEHSAKLGKSVWLETTKPENIKIFEKWGLALIHRKEEQETAYFMMAIKQAGETGFRGK